jgi:hypothetical protein
MNELTSTAISKEKIFEDFTIERTVDELYLNLMKEKDNLYYKQAYALMYYIPVEKPIPILEIKISDLNKQVKKELDDRWNDRKTIDYILKEAVGRIFENIEERYFLLSVKRLLQVRLIQ